ncbi:MAG: MltA domain-containing protein [Steroidobacteraceae bacterium]|nr:MltA domain-containing protein [Steroidobacteraceae bacterium]
MRSGPISRKSGSGPDFFVLALLALLSACTTTRKPTPVVAPVARFEAVSWDKLPGWRTDDALAAWPAFVSSCSVIHSRPEWQPFCGAVVAASPGDADFVRDFIEQHLTPYRVVRMTGRKRDTNGLVTGYYEPLLRGSRERAEPFTTPLYRRPDDLLVVDLAALYPELKGKRVRGRLDGNKVVPFYSRAQTREAPGLRGYEIVWIDDALDAFLLEVQGSGRVKLSTGETIRLQYADQNGQPYRSIGRYLADQGVMNLEDVTMPAIRAWLAANPARAREVLDSNPSVVFFAESALDDPSIGPKGALGVPLTTGRSIAVDPAVVALGAPVFLSTSYPSTGLPLQRLVVAQDTGGAIRGPVRADLFFGFGDEAGALAGTMKQDGEMWILWPKGAPLP